jgi:hypothetical protein
MSRNSSKKKITKKKKKKKNCYGFSWIYSSRYIDTVAKLQNNLLKKI